MKLKWIKNLHFVELIVVFLANKYLLLTFALISKNRKEYLIKVII